MANLVDTGVNGDLRVTGNIYGNLSGNATTATTWATGREFKIQDADATNTGTTVTGVNGSGNVTLKLPSTIKATLTGNATTCTYPYGFASRTSTLPNWGTLKDSTKYDLVTTWATDSTEIVFAKDKSTPSGHPNKTLSVQVDGYFYQNEGTYRVLDSSDGMTCGICGTPAGTAAKVANAMNYTASVGNTILVRFTNPNSAAGALTLNLGGVTKTIKWNGTVTASGTTSAIPAGTWPCYYDGTYWNIWTDGTFEGQAYRGALLPVGAISAGGRTSTWACIGKIQRSTLASNTWGSTTLLIVHTPGLNGPSDKYTIDTYILTFMASTQDSAGKITLLNSTDNPSKTFATFYTNYDSASDSWILYAKCSTDKNYASYQIYEFPYTSASNSFKFSSDGMKFLDAEPSSKTAITGYISALFPSSITDNQVVLTSGANGVLKTTGTLAVGNGGTGMTTSTNVNAVVIGNSTTATNAMQTVRTGNGAFYATAQDAKPTFGTLPIAQGGTGATTRLNALKALTNESVGTNATYFLTITNSWGKGGYTSVAEAKTVLGIGDISNGNVGAGTTGYGVLVAEITVSTGVETAEYLATFFVDTNFGIKNYVKEVIDVKFIFRNSASTGNYAVWYARAEHRMSHDSSQMPVYFAYKTDANKASIYILWSSDGSATSGTWRIKVQSLSKLGCTSVSYPGTTLSAKLTGFSSFNEVYMVKTAYRSATGTTSKPVYVDAYGAIQPCDQYAGGTAVTLNNSPKTGTTASFYAPTAGGTANYVLIGNGATSAPTWAEKAPNATAADTATTAENNVDSVPLRSGMYAMVAASNTVPNLLDEVRVLYGARCGSVEIKTAYTKDNVTISTGWYNFEYLPHRSGGSTGDNHQYGTLILSGMTVDKTFYVLRRNGKLWQLTNSEGSYPDMSVGTATNSTNSTNSAVAADTTHQLYLIGATGSSGQQALKTDTGIYATATAGQLHATTFDVNSKCTLQFNTTTNALDFVFT